MATLIRERYEPLEALAAGGEARVVKALDHQHGQAAPVIHGDVKPGNLILTSGGRLKFVDFGMSSTPTRRAAAAAPSASVHPSSPSAATPRVPATSTRWRRRRSRR